METNPYTESNEDADGRTTTPLEPLPCEPGERCNQCQDCEEYARWRAEMTAIETAWQR